MRPRIAGQENKLFLLVIEPHEPVSASTGARWARNVLQGVGIDTSQFKPHSFRGASASTTARGGVTLSDVLAMASWSSDSTFKRFYYKLVLHPDASRAVLRGCQQKSCVFEHALLHGVECFEVYSQIIQGIPVV